MNPKLIITLWVLIYGHLSFAQGQFANTLEFNENTGSPKASLANVNWVTGHWRGEAFGGITEEIWSPPLGHSMMCAFRSVVNGKVKFYELVTITEENETLKLRLKHFHANLKGWEEKDVTQDFRLVKITNDRVYFEAFTFERMSDNEINMYVVIGREGGREEMKFNYKRWN